MLHVLKPLSLVVLMLLVTGCGGAYYGATEKIGGDKRDILADRVVEARDSQQAAKEQFLATLDRFSAVVNFNGEDLKGKYRALKQGVQQSEARADEVRKRAAAVETEAEAQFAEWQEELDQYNSVSSRQTSEKQLKQTRDQYARLLGAMKQAETRIDPALDPLRDQVQFLKLNLNGRAIASLAPELLRIETAVSLLSRDLDQAMQEADSFIQVLKTE